MTEPAKCYCGSLSWERNIEENRYNCCSCKRPLWQPAETAPRDGSIILGYFSNEDGSMFMSHIMWVRGNEHIIGHQDKPVGPNCWFSLLASASVEPTHWMPLPDEPGHD